MKYSMKATFLRYTSSPNKAPHGNPSNMMKFLRMKQYFGQAYPYYWNRRGLHKLLIFIVLASFVFNYAFQPFEVYIPEHKMDFLWICAIHAVVPGFVGYLYFPIINLYGADEGNWTIGKEVAHVMLFLLLVGIGSFLVRDIIYDNPKNWSFRYLCEEIRNTFMVGILFALVFVPLNFNRLLKKYEHDAAAIQSKASPNTPAAVPDNCIVSIQTQVRNDDFHLEVSHMLFAKAAGNYVEIFTESGGKIEVLLKRIPIKDLELQLAPFGHIMKTHRAYLVNTCLITEVKGNAQGYQLSFDGVVDAVPVARSMIDAFNSAMRNQV